MTDDLSTPEGADANPEKLGPGQIPHPGHSLETAKRCIHESCDPDEHDWVELTGFSEPAYWRECKSAGSRTSRPPRSARTSRRANIDERNEVPTTREGKR